MRRSQLGWALIALALAGCNDELHAWLPWPDTDPAATLLVSVSARSVNTITATDARRHDRALRLPGSFPTGDDTASVYAVALTPAIEELGLVEGEVQSGAGDLLLPAAIHAAHFDGQAFSAWASQHELPAPFSGFRLPGHACTRFELEPIADAPSFVVATLPLDDGGALLVGRDQLVRIDASAHKVEAAPGLPSGMYAAFGEPGEPRWVASGMELGRVHFDPLSVEVVSRVPATGTSTQPIAWLSATHGAEPQVYGFTGYGVLLRLWPGPFQELGSFMDVVRGRAYGGVVALGPDDVVAVTHNRDSVLHYVNGEIARQLAPALATGFDGALRVDDQAILIEQVSANLFRFDGRSFVPLELKGLPMVRAMSSYKGTYVGGTESGELVEYRVGAPCARLLAPMRSVFTIAPFGDGLIVGGTGDLNAPIWFWARPQ